MSLSSSGTTHPDRLPPADVPPGEHPRQEARARSGRSRRFSIARAILFSLLIFDLSLLVTTYRISAAPDIFTDEIIYTRAAVRVAGEGALVWDTGDPFLVHPPLYFLTAGAFHYFTGDPATPLYAAGNIFSTVFHMRILNSIFAALTAVVLYWFGRQIMGDWLGLFYAALFILDPFALRINRRAMLETLAVLLGTSALLVYFYDLQRLSHRLVRLMVSPWTLLAGLLMGASLLTKELAFVYLLVPALFALWELWRQHLSALIGFGGTPPAPEYGAETGWIVPVRSAVVIFIALLLYAVYPLWVATYGYLDKYLAEKSLGMLRLFGLVQITGWNRPGISFVDLLLERLAQYGTSYLLLAAGGLALVAILIWGRRSLAGRLLASAGLVFYPIFGFIAVFGSGNDQFFYFLLTPAILLVGYALVALPSQVISWRQAPASLSEVAPTTPEESSPEKSPPESATPSGINPDTQPVASTPPPGAWSSYPSRPTSRFAVLATSLLLAVIFSFNAWRWWSNYAKGTDNAYTQFAAFVRDNLPPGEPINASGDPIKFRYFLPDRPISFAADPQEALQTNVHYYALAPKDVLMHYGRIQPQLEAWIQKYGTPIFSASGNSYGDVYLYEVSAVPSDQSMMIITGKHAAQGTRFDLAKGGTVWSLVLILMILGIGFSLLVAWLVTIENRRGKSELSLYLSTLLGGRGTTRRVERAKGQDPLGQEHPEEAETSPPIQTGHQGDMGD